MAEYYHLDVYKASYKLLVELFKSLKNLNKEHKYTLGEKIKEKSFDILIQIYKTNSAENKLEYINTALDSAEYIRLSLRLLRDLNILNDDKFVHLNEYIEDVSQQFEKWRGFIQKKR